MNNTTPTGGNCLKIDHRVRVKTLKDHRSSSSQGRRGQNKPVSNLTSTRLSINMDIVEDFAIEGSNATWQALGGGRWVDRRRRASSWDIIFADEHITTTHPPAYADPFLARTSSFEGQRAETTAPPPQRNRKKMAKDGGTQCAVGIVGRPPTMYEIIIVREPSILLYRRPVQSSTTD
ncbi:hypothetical protein CPC08DRAFT_821443 [Agrocybe pediades]|nr:hypothetical protein CPC08DRAFT_821443 [Agrocybe pediades]